MHFGHKLQPKTIILKTKQGQIMKKIILYIDQLREQKLEEQNLKNLRTSSRQKVTTSV